MSYMANKYCICICNINYQFDITEEKKFSYERSAHIPCYILQRRSLRDHYLSSKGWGGGSWKISEEGEEGEVLTGP